MARFRTYLHSGLSIALMLFGGLVVIDGILPIRSQGPYPSWFEIALGTGIVLMGFFFRRMASNGNEGSGKGRGSRSWILVLVSLGSVLSLASLHAQLPSARLWTVFPSGGKAGTSFEVSVTGADLDEANRLIFSQSNLTAAPKLTANNEPEPNKFVVNIGTGVAPGFHEVRVLGRFGVSNPRVFVVGDLPESSSPETNHSAATAFEVTVDSVVNGRADAGAADYFKFHARKGQRILIRCAAAEIDSRLDEILVLFDAAGREVARSRRGNLLDFAPPQDGIHVLQLHDITYRGGPEFHYRLTFSSGPQIDHIFPPSGLAGTRGPVELYGYHLPGGSPAAFPGAGLEKITVEIDWPTEAGTLPAPGHLLRPAGAVIDGFTHSVTSAQGASNPVLLSLATGPVVIEQEPNNPGAQKVAPPCEVTGRFDPPGDIDWFSFDARKGDVWWIEVFSHRLGLPTDPFLLIQRMNRDDQGVEKTADTQELYDADSNIGGPEFNTASRDPIVRFEAKEDGLHRIQVRDLFGRVRSHPRHVYRLSIRRESPDFRLVVLPQPPPPLNRDAKEAVVWTPFLRRGETIPVKILVFRRDGFAGEIQLAIEGLPEGVTFGPTAIGGEQNAKTVLLSAAENAVDWSGPIRVIGRATIAGTEIRREARTASAVWTVPDYNNEAIENRFTRDAFLAVSAAESAPVSVEPAENRPFETGTSARLSIPLKVTRRGEFTETLKLKATGITALDPLKELEVDGKTNAATLEIDLAQQKLPPGRHTFFLQAQTRGKYRNNPEAAKAAEEAAKAADQLAVESAAEAKKTQEALAAATKALEEAEGHAKAATAKLAAATSAAENAPANDELVSAKNTAENDASAASDKANQAIEAKVLAARLAEEAAARVKEAETGKVAAAERAKKANEKAQPRDVTLTVYSAPITVLVNAEEKK